MIHIEVLGHGPRFRAKLQELATAGETWAEEAINKYIDEDDPIGDEIEILKEQSSKNGRFEYQLSIKRRL